MKTIQQGCPFDETGTIKENKSIKLFADEFEANDLFKSYNYARKNSANGDIELIANNKLFLKIGTNGELIVNKLTSDQDTKRLYGLINALLHSHEGYHKLLSYHGMGIYHDEVSPCSCNQKGYFGKYPSYPKISDSSNFKKKYINYDK